jgi:hypothetical protein
MHALMWRCSKEQVKASVVFVGMGVGGVHAARRMVVRIKSVSFIVKNATARTNLQLSNSFEQLLMTLNQVFKVLNLLYDQFRYLFIV